MAKFNRKKIYVYQNNMPKSDEAYGIFVKETEDRGYEITEQFDETVGLITCIGGDGTFLRLMHTCNFPPTPIIGINTGHLGFFQEIRPEDITDFLDFYEKQKYSLQSIWPIDARIVTDQGTFHHRCLNEIVIRGPHTHLTHLAIQIDQSLVQEFYGDGVLISTSAGSTAYNYALGGAIMSPQLNAIQITPIAPSNTSAYRCFRSSIIFPSTLQLSLSPIKRTCTDSLEVIVDGIDTLYKNVQSITISRAESGVHLIRFSDYDYWNKLKTKLL